MFFVLKKLLLFIRWLVHVVSFLGFSFSFFPSVNGGVARPLGNWSIHSTGQSPSSAESPAMGRLQELANCPAGPPPLSRNNAPHLFFLFLSLPNSSFSLIHHLLYHIIFYVLILRSDWNCSKFSAVKGNGSVDLFPEQHYHFAWSSRVILLTAAENLIKMSFPLRKDHCFQTMLMIKPALWNYSASTTIE